MNAHSLIKKLDALDAAINSKGIGLINTKSGDVEYKAGFTADTLKILNNSLESGRFNELNSKFNSIFYQRGFPELITIKYKLYSEFIRMIDEEHLMYFVQENTRVNYTKVKIQFSKIFEM